MTVLLVLEVGCTCFWRNGTYLFLAFRSVPVCVCVVLGPSPLFLICDGGGIFLGFLSACSLSLAFSNENRYYWSNQYEIGESSAEEVGSFR